MKAPPHPPRYIFLIDDDEITNLIHSTQISRFDPHIEVRVHTDAQAALEELLQLREAQPGSMPDLILLDINMPGMDGWDFLAAFEGHNLSCHLMMLTSSVDDKDREKALAFTSVSGFISKPLNSSILRQLMGK
ncbi:MAG: response regulator [Bacteroidetes bacterium]|nr:MAG: response regulator [Bacteroidota bacterium]